MQLPIGVHIAGRYHIRHLLGRGGMGTVYAAYDTIQELHCAIKYLDLPGSAAQQQFALEAELLKELRSPRVPRVYAYLPTFELPGQVLVM